MSEFSLALAGLDLVVVVYYLIPFLFSIYNLVKIVHLRGDMTWRLRTYIEFPSVFGVFIPMISPFPAGLVTKTTVHSHHTPSKLILLNIHHHLHQPI